MNTKDTQQNNLKDIILGKIESESPTSKMVFFTRECLVWSLWAIATLFGAVAVAVMLFVGSHQMYAVYEATHESWYAFLLEFLPFLWLGTFTLMTVVAIYNIQHTKRAYKYPVWQIVASSLVVSLVGGVLLQFFGFGYVVDYQLGEQMAAYRSLEQQEQSLWQRPEEGRMIGFLTKDATLIDETGVEWAIETSNLLPDELNELQSGKLVRLVGTTSNEVFVACAVFPLIKPGQVPVAEMKKQRAKLQDKKIYMQKEMADTDSVSSNICHKIPMQERLLRRK